VLRSQAEADEAAIESSYTIVRGLIWAIPVLGFIGTVIGLSQAIGAFGSVLATTAEINALKPALQSVTAGLATAFETTLHALVAALGVQMILVMLKRTEEQMLDDFMEYCQRRIVNRLRLHEVSRFGEGTK
jgi:biopolymer transport protein ExbB/TolQ